MTDWIAIKNEYISTRISMRDLAEKHCVSYSTLDKRARKERWASERVEHGGKVEAKVRQKTAAAVATKEADRITRLLSIGDKLVTKLEQATGELDRSLARHKQKTRTVVYGDTDAKGKPTKEVIVEVEMLDSMPAPIDRLGLRQLAAALKDLRDVARVETEEGANGGISIAFEGAFGGVSVEEASG